MKMNEVMDLNNQVLQMSKEARRFHYAMNEIKNLSWNKKLIRPIGFMVRAHGFTFEWNHIGWILRPHGYLSHAEVMERYPAEEERKSYYVWYNSKIRTPSF